MICKKCNQDLSTDHFSPSMLKKGYCKVCKAQMDKVTVDSTRKIIFDRYGSTCVYCGSESDLQLDHIDGLGAKHRLDLMGGRTAGYPFYKKLIALGLPDGFQATCTTCNRMKTNLNHEEFLLRMQQILKYVGVV